MADRQIKTIINVNEGTITFENLSNASDVYVFDASAPSVENQTYATFHGWKQRLSDEVSAVKSAAEKMAGIRKLGAYYEDARNTSWNLARATGPKPFDSGAVVTALAQVKFAGDIDKTNSAVEKVAAKRNISREETLKIFAQDADVAAQMERNRLAARKVTVNADDLLGDMEEPQTTEE